ncbi:cell envelope biogenesis protein AsmA [Nitrospira sp.]|nr:cell envelope biogenesis protein AsmA [Nitrospira sp.]
MKILLATVALVLLLVLTLLALPFLVDLNKYVTQYKPQLEEALGRSIELEDVRLTIWPRLGARIGGFAIMEDPRFGTKPFASFASLDVGVKLWPLLKGRIEVEEISLRAPVITVIKDQQGVLNVSSIGPKRPPDSAATSPQTPSQPQGGALRALALLAVERVMLTDGQLTYRDLAAAPIPTEYVLHDLEARLAEVQLGHVATVYLRAVVQPVDLPVTLDGVVGPLKESGELERVDVELGLGKTVLALKGSLKGGRAQVTLASPMINSTDLPAHVPLTKPFTVNNLRVHVELPSPMPMGASPLDVVTIEPLKMDVAMGGSMLSLAGAVTNRRAKVSIYSDSVSTADLPLQLNLAKPVLVKKLRIEAEAPVPLRDGISPLDQITVKPVELEAAMGRSTVAVRGSAVDGEVNVEATTPLLRTGDLPISIAALQESVELKNVRLAAHMKGQRIRLTNLSLGLFDGQLHGQGGVTANATPVPFDGTIALKRIQLEPMMKALGVGAVRLSGTADVDVSARGRGFSMPDLTRTLEGSARLDMADGTLEGINLTREVAALFKVAGISPDAVKMTVISTLQATLGVKQGVATVRNLLLDGPEVRATGRGTVGFDQTVDLKVDVALSQALSQKIAAAPLARLAMRGGRLTVPVLIGGTLQSPTYALDATEISGKVQEQIQKQIEERVQQESEKLLKEKSGEAIRKGTESLKRLFGQ